MPVGRLQSTRRVDGFSILDSCIHKYSNLFSLIFVFDSAIPVLYNVAA